jgi:hypothetical protein
VNVAIGDITTGDILSNNTVNLAVAANIGANVCGVTVPVAVLAQQVFRTGGFTCEGATQFVQITQRRPYSRPLRRVQPPRPPVSNLRQPCIMMEQWCHPRKILGSDLLRGVCKAAGAS